MNIYILQLYTICKDATKISGALVAIWVVGDFISAGSEEEGVYKI